MVEVYPDTVVVSVIPVDGAGMVFDLDANGCRAVIAAHPIEREHAADRSTEGGCSARVGCTVCRPVIE